MNICAVLLASVALSGPLPSEADPVTALRLDSLKPGDRLIVETTDQTLLIEMVRPTDGEVRLATSEFATPVRAYINGSTRGPQPELFVLMGVVKPGLRLEIVETKAGGPGAIDRRHLSAPVLRYQIKPRDRAI